MRVSVGDEPDGASGYSAIAPDARFVAFAAFATNLVDGDTNGKDEVFVRRPEGEEDGPRERGHGRHAGR